MRISVTREGEREITIGSDGQVRTGLHVIVCTSCCKRGSTQAEEESDRRHPVLRRLFAATHMLYLLIRTLLLCFAPSSSLAVQLH